MLTSYRPFVGLVCVLALLARTSNASEEPNPKPDPPEIESFEVSPMAEPVPAFKYRLYPLSSLRKPGNAAPIYLRFAHERSGETRKELFNGVDKFMIGPIDSLDKAAARAFINRWGYNLRQIDHAAHKTTCDWNYTVEEEMEHVYEMLLPDAQEMRQQHKLICVQARVQMAEGKNEEALRSLETAFSMSSQLGEGPFLINGLIGIATAMKTADQVIDFIQRPGAPNLYWALTTLPTQLVPIRRGVDMEFAIGDLVCREFDQLDQPAAPAEWQARLDRLTARLNKLRNYIPKDEKIKSIVLDAKDPATVKLARDYLTSRNRFTPAQLDAMTHPQMILWAVRDQYHEIRDMRFKVLMLPAWEARRFVREISPKEEAKKPAELVTFAEILAPLLNRPAAAEPRLDRRIAALRLIEGLRLHAASHGGKLPASLDEVQEVTLPHDPATGKAFDYKLEGANAVIESSGLGDTFQALKYTVKLRKSE